MTSLPTTRDEGHARLVERAMRDEAFRERLKSDPKAAIQEAFGVTWPDGVEIQVHEETADTVHIVLPAMPETSRELTAAELAAVAGGRDRKNTLFQTNGCGGLSLWSC